MQNMDPVDESKNTESHTNQKTLWLTLNATQSYFNTCEGLWAVERDICLHTFRRKTYYPWNPFTLLLSGCRVMCVQRQKVSILNDEWWRWQCLQEVIPTDPSSWPLTPNLQRLKEGLAYEFRRGQVTSHRTKTERGWVLRNTDRNSEVNGQKSVMDIDISLKRPSFYESSQQRQNMHSPEIALGLQQTMSNCPACFLTVSYLGPPPSHGADVELGY